MNEISEARSERATHQTKSNTYILAYRNLKLPDFDSLEGKCLKILLTGKRLSHLDFQGMTESYRLSAPICELRKHKKYPIQDVWRKNPAGKRFKEYFISNENIQLLHLALGERLTLFVEAIKKVS